MSADRIHFTVPGQPVPKGRARFARVGLGVKTFTPEKTVIYENLVRMQADAAMASRAPLPGPIRLDIDILLQVPASWSNRRQTKAIEGDIAATKKPDADNVLKAIKDGMNGVVYVDDSQVVEIRVSKRYGAIPGVSVVVEPLARESA